MVRDTMNGCTHKSISSRMGWYNEDDGDNGYRLDYAGKMIGIVMTPNLRMATIGAVRTPMPWTTGMPLTIQATTGAYSHMEMATMRTMMTFIDEGSGIHSERDRYGDIGVEY